MKKIIAVCTFSAFCLVSIAQTDTVNNKDPYYPEQQNPQQNQTDQWNKDQNKQYDQNQNKQSDQNQKNEGQNMNKNKNQNKSTTQSSKNDTTNCTVQMKNGKVMKVTSEGTTVALDRDMTLPNGTVVMADGTVRMKDGKTMRLKEGECLSRSGKTTTPKNKNTPTQSGTR